MSNEEAQLLQVNLVRTWAGSGSAVLSVGFRADSLCISGCKRLRWGGILLKEDGSFTEIWDQNWSEAEKAKPINWRETKTAIEC